MSNVAKRFRRLTAVTAGLAVAAVAGLGVPAGAAQDATSGYKPSGNEWWLANWRVPQQVWPLSAGAGVTVAVVDSGVQASIPDLRGVVLRGSDMLTKPGNGDIDYSTDSDGHGTAVSVLIAGQGYGTGTVGIAPQVKILPVHVLYPVLTNFPAHLAEGIEYAVNHGAGVINISLAQGAPSATSCDPVIQNAVAYALAHNVVVVAGSGDTNLTGSGPQEPASCAGVLAVGGVGPDGSLWKYSTQGSNVAIVAPGDHLVYVGLDGRYTTSGYGTSFSAPLVAGAAALIRSRYPSMPWYQVVQRLIGTAIHFGSPVPNDAYGYGIINVAKAVNASAFPVSASSPNPVYARYLGWLSSPAGQAWAKANGVQTTPTAKASAPNAGASASSAAAPKPGSGGLGTLLIVVIVVIVAAAALVLALVLRSRNRSGSRNGSFGIRVFRR
jgi:type VII secretion-associated serine protease mycosin